MSAKSGLLIQDITGKLRYDIIMKKYAPGTSLTELQMAEEYGCTRTAIRAAMTVMEDEGLLKISANGRKKVLGVEEKDIYNIYELRNYIEQTAVTQFMQNPRREFASIIDVLKRITDHTDKTLDAMLETDGRLHRAVIEASGNRILLQTWNNINGIINAMFQINMQSSETYRRWFVDTFCDRHILLFSALLKDIPTAQEVFRNHIVEARETSIEAFRQVRMDNGEKQ